MPSDTLLAGAPAATPPAAGASTGAGAAANTGTPPAGATPPAGGAAATPPVTTPAAGTTPPPVTPAAGEAAGKPVVPETYELKLPADAVIDAKALETTSALAKELGLTSNEHAQKVLDYGNSVALAAREALVAQHEANVVKWMADVEADKDFGGANFKGNVEAAKNLVEKYGDSDLKQALFDSGYGNFPPLVKMFAKIGKLMNEDGHHTGTPPNPDANKVFTFEDAVRATKPSSVGS